MFIFNSGSTNPGGDNTDTTRPSNDKTLITLVFL